MVKNTTIFTSPVTTIYKGNRIRSILNAIHIETSVLSYWFTAISNYKYNKIY